MCKCTQRPAFIDLCTVHHGSIVLYWRDVAVDNEECLCKVGVFLLEKRLKGTIIAAIKIQRGQWMVNRSKKSHPCPEQ